MILSTCSSSPALRARQHAQEAKNEYVEKSLVPELCASIEHVIGTRASVCSPMAVNSSLVRCEYVVNQYNLMYISLQLTPLVYTCAWFGLRRRLGRLGTVRACHEIYGAARDGLGVKYPGANLEVKSLMDRLGARRRQIGRAHV